jgi:hypothetical protein
MKTHFRTTASNPKFARSPTPFTWALLTLLALTFLAGCQTRPYPGNSADQSNAEADPKAIQTGRALDQMETIADNYGFVTMSAPILIVPNPDLSFDLSKNATDYYNDARTNLTGSSGVLNQSILQVAAGLSAGANFGPPALPGLPGAAGGKKGGNSTAAASSPLQTSGNINLTYAGNVTNITGNGTLVATPAAAAGDSKSNASSGGAREGNNISDGGNTSTSPTPDSTDAILKQLTTQLATLQGLVGNFTANQGLLPAGTSGNIVATNRSAIITAAGDNAVAAFFKIFGDGDSQFYAGEKKLYFGLVTISVNPGPLTQQGFVARVNALTSLEYDQVDYAGIQEIVNSKTLPERWHQRLMKDYGIPDSTNTLTNTGEIKPVGNYEAIPDYMRYADDDPNFEPPSPSVLIFSPLTDSEVFDDSGSYRNETAFALTLSLMAAFSQGSGNFSSMINSINQQQEDLRIRRANNAVNSFSSGGGLFGFEIGPRLEVSGNLASLYSNPANVLDRLSFPAVLVMLFDAEDLRPRLGWVDGKLVAYRPELDFFEQPQWVPMDKVLSKRRIERENSRDPVVKQYNEHYELQPDGSWSPAPSNGIDRYEGMDETSKLRAAVEFNQAMSSIDSGDLPSPDPSNHTLQEKHYYTTVQNLTLCHADHLLSFGVAGSSNQVFFDPGTPLQILPGATIYVSGISVGRKAPHNRKSPTRDNAVNSVGFSGNLDPYNLALPKGHEVRLAVSANGTDENGIPMQLPQGSVLRVDEPQTFTADTSNTVLLVPAQAPGPASQSNEGLKKYAKYRGDILHYQVYGATASQDMPMELDHPPVVPEISQIAPRMIQLISTGNSTSVSANATFILAGNHLADLQGAGKPKMDPGRITLLLSGGNTDFQPSKSFASNLTSVALDGGTISGNVISAEFVGNALLLTVNFQAQILSGGNGSAKVGMPADGNISVATGETASSPDSQSAGNITLVLSDAIMATAAATKSSASAANVVATNAAAVEAATNLVTAAATKASAFKDNEANFASAVMEFEKDARKTNSDAQSAVQAAQAAASATLLAQAGANVSAASTEDSATEAANAANAAAAKAYGAAQDAVNPSATPAQAAVSAVLAAAANAASATAATRAAIAKTTAETKVDADAALIASTDAVNSSVATAQAMAQAVKSTAEASESAAHAAVPNADSATKTVAANDFSKANTDVTNASEAAIKAVVAAKVFLGTATKAATTANLAVSALATSAKPAAGNITTVATPALQASLVFQFAVDNIKSSLTMVKGTWHIQSPVVTLTVAAKAAGNKSDSTTGSGNSTASVKTLTISLPPQMTSALNLRVADPPAASNLTANITNINLP